jgi:glutathione S-transferase
MTLDPTVYHYKPTRSNRALWALAELDLTPTEVVVDVVQGEQKRPEYLAIHPLGKVPALVVDGRPLFESAAIVMHLADRHPGARLAPEPGSHQRGLYYQWIVFGPAEVDPQLTAILVHTRILPPAQRVAAVADEARRELALRARVLARALADRPFLLGEQFSAADIVIGHDCAWARMLDVLDEFPELVDYLHRLERRPAFARVYGERVEVFPDPHAS